MVPHPGLDPCVMSFSVPAGRLYSSWFRNPRGGRPAATRSMLRSAMMLANVGALALVPSTLSCCPATTTEKPTPCAATSGNPRPVVLNLPAFVLPSRCLKAATADAW